jgi:hypothetical protein
MADETPSLDIDIRINADTTQGAAAKAVIRDVGQEAAAAGQQVNALGGHGASAFGKLVTGGRAAHGAMMGLNTAMQGGAATAVGLARALNDVFILVRSAAISSGPFVLLALAIGAVLGIMRGLASHSHAAGAGMKHAADSAKELKQALSMADAEAKKDFAQMEKDAKALAVSFRDVADALSEAEHRAKALFAAEKELASASLSAQEAKELAGLDPKAADYAQRKQATELKFKGLRASQADNFAQAEMENDILRAKIQKDAMLQKLAEMRNQRLRAGETADAAGTAAAGATQEAFGAINAVRRQPFMEDASSAAGNIIRAIIPFMSTKLPVDSNLEILRQREHEAVLKATAAQEKARKEKEKADDLAAKQEQMRDQAQKAIAAADTTMAVAPIKLKTQRAKESIETLSNDQAVKKQRDSDSMADSSSRQKVEEELASIHNLQTSGFSTSFGNPAYAKAMERGSVLEKQLDEMNAAQAWRDQMILEQLSRNAAQSKKTAKQMENTEALIGGM